MVEDFIVLLKVTIEAPNRQRAELAAATLTTIIKSATLGDNAIATAARVQYCEKSGL